MTEHWYLAACRPKQDERAVINLQNQQIKVFAPRVMVKKILRGKRVLRDEPLFPGYLFIQISPESPLWSKVRSTFGVRDWVRFGGKPARVPDKLMTSLLGQDAQGAEAEVIDFTFTSGQKVIINEGPFAGLEAIYQCESGEERSMVLIEFLGKSNRICVDNRQLSLADNHLA